MPLADPTLRPANWEMGSSRNRRWFDMWWLQVLYLTCSTFFGVGKCLSWEFWTSLEKVFAGDSILNWVCVYVFLLFNILQWLICIHISCFVLGTRELVRVSQPHGSIQKSNSQHPGNIEWWLIIHDNTMMINYQGWFTNMIKLLS